MRKFPFPIRTRTYFQHSSPSDRMSATILHCKCSESWLPGNHASDTRTSLDSSVCYRCVRLSVEKSTNLETVHGKRTAPVRAQFYDDLAWQPLLETFPILSIALRRGTIFHTHAAVFRHRLYLPSRRMSSTEAKVQRNFSSQNKSQLSSATLTLVTLSAFILPVCRTCGPRHKSINVPQRYTVVFSSVIFSFKILTLNSL